MKKHLRRMVAFFLCVTLLASLSSAGWGTFDFSALFTTSAKAETIEDETTIHGTVGTKLTWRIDKETKVLSVDCPGAMPDFSSTTAPWKNYSEQFQTLIITEGCTEISNNAFYQCYSLTSVTIPDSVTSIGNYAFYNCTGLTSVTIPGSVKSLGSSAFYYCTNLTSVTIGNGIISIGSGAFEYCDRLSSVTIPDSVTSIGSTAFNLCTKLTNVTIGNGVTSIGSSAFYKCTALTEVTVPFRINQLNRNQFSGCSSLEKITIFNRNCQLSQSALPITATLYGFSGSTTETFANTYGYSFVSIDDIHEHVYSGNCDETCNLCGDTRSVEDAHHLGAYVTVYEPTCFGPGYAEAVCADCGATITKELPALDHLYGDWAVTAEPTCAEYGEKECVCSRCGHTIRETIPKTDHIFSDWTVTAEPTCAEYGEKECVCSRCGDTIWESIPKTDHSFSDWTVSQPATCDHPGYETRTCGACGATESRPIEQTAHTDADGDGICDICHRSVSTQYVAAGQCGPNAFWKLDSEGNLEIYGSGVTLDIDKNSATTQASTTAAPTTTHPATNAPTYGPEPATRDGYNQTTKYYNTTASYDPLTTTKAPATTTARRTVSMQPASKQLVGVDPPADPMSTTAAPATSHAGPTVPEDPLAQSIPWRDFQERIRTVTVAPGITGLGANAFSGCISLTAVSLPSSLVVIGSSAFSGCTALQELTLPKNLSTVGYRAFEGCTGLKTLHYQSTSCSFKGWSGWSVDSAPFDSCSALTTLVLGDGVQSLPNIPTIRTVIVEDGVKSIARRQFYGWSQITALTLPDSLERIEAEAFRNCSGMTELTLPEHLLFVGDYAFWGCTALKTLVYKCINCETNGTWSWYWDDTISEEHYVGSVFGYTNLQSVQFCTSVASIPRALLCGATSLTNVEIPASVRSIGAYAFCDCTGLTTLTLPEGITTLGDSAFGNCTALTTLQYNCVNCAVPYSYSYAPFSGCDQLANVTIGDRVAVIPYAFLYGKKQVKAVTVPSSVTKISDYAFYNSGLTSIQLPDSVTFLGSNVFAYASQIETLTVPESVTYIGYNTFAYMTGLKTLYYNAVNAQKGEEWYNDIFRGAGAESGGFSVIFGNRVEVLLRGMFYGCEYLKSVTLPPLITEIPERAFSGTGLKAVTLPAHVQAIGPNAFFDCAPLTSVAISNSVTTIGAEAFGCCASLTSLTIPDSVTSIDNSAFICCSGMKDLKIGNGVTSIGGSAFSGCASLVSLTIPDNVTSIGNYAFSSCTGITDIIIGSGVKQIGNQAFANCTGLTSIQYNATACEIIGSRNHEAFLGCTGVETVAIGSNVTYLPAYAFTGCDNLRTIYIPDTAIKIHQAAFAECYNAMIVCKSGTYAHQFAVQNLIEYQLQDSADAVFTIKNDVLLAYQGTAKNVVVPADVKAIGVRAFAGNAAVECVELPYSVTVIYDSAFADCGSLRRVIVPFTVTSIHANAFSGSNAAIACCSGAYAQTFAQAHDLTCEIITVSFGAGPKRMQAAETLQLAAMPSIPLACGLPMTFVSDAPDVATVDAGGLVTAVSAGTATVTACGVNDEALGSVQIEVSPFTAPPAPVIAHFQPARSEAYKTTITFTAEATNLPEGATVHWFVNGKDQGPGETCTVKQATEDYTVQCKILDSNGNVLSESETETVKIKASFFAKLIAFFRQLFGRLPVLSQALRGED